MKEMFTQSNNRSIVSPLSPVSDNGSGDVSINLSAIPSDKLFAVLQNIEDDCRFCAKKTGEHVHYIVSSQLVIDPSIELPKLVDIEPKKCYACGNNNSDLKLCSQCKTATYCDTRCQLNDWSKHSAVCGVECNGMDVTDTSVSRIIESRSKPKNNITIVSPKSVAKEAPKESTPIIEANSAPKQSLNSASTLVRTVPNASSAKTVESKPKIKPYKLDIEYEQIKTGDSVSVCFGRNPSDFYVHKDSNLNKIEDISEKLTKIESFEFTESNLPKDAACIGLYEPDGLWYRASVVGKVSANEYALQFIDYGNTERVTRDNIKALPSQFFDIKAQATHCKLSSIVPIEREWSEKACIYFGKLGETQEYAQCVVKDNIDGIYSIDLVNKDGDAVSKELVKKNLAKTEHMDKDDDVLVNNVSKVSINDVSPKASPNKDEKSLTKSPQVIFNKTSVNSDGKRLIPLQAQLNQLKATKRNISSIVCSLNANDSATALATDIYNKDKGQYWTVFDGTKYSHLYENLQKEYTANKLDCEPNVGDFVVIKASDEDFYRAFVFDSQNDKFKVLMIDTGYIEEVSCAYVLDPKYYRYSAFSMLVIARNSEGKAKLQDFYEESQHFEPLVISQNEGEAVIKIDGLLFDALAFNLALDKVVNAIEAQPIDFINALGSRDIDLNKKMEVLVLYQNTEDKNIFHIAGDADSLTDVMGKCASSGEKFEDAIQPKSGDIYLVKHSDGEWYRALILSTGNTIVAFFIDFGNTDDITPEFIMALPSELSISSIPGIAIKCVVNPSQKNLKDIHKKIEKAADGTYLLKIEATNKEGNAFHVNVY